MVVAEIPSLDRPIVIDIFDVNSKSKHQYDLPFYYNGQFIETDFKVNTFTDYLKPLGKDHGYQYLWLNGTGKSSTGNAQFTWMNNNRFYTLTMLTNKQTEIHFLTIGANDPNFNLRHEPAIMLRQPDSGNHLFLSVIEPHGEFNPIAEFTKGARSQIETISVKNSGGFNTVTLKLKNGEAWELNVPDSVSGEQAVTYKQKE
jgi:hypothetical protein